MSEVITNFKPPKRPNKPKGPSAAERREGNSKAHLALIRQLPSCISGRKPCDPHHLRISSERGVGRKSTDRWAVPLTRDEHDEVHKVGSRKEFAWFQDRGIDCYGLASALWTNTGDLERMDKIIEGNRPAHD